MQLTIPNRQSDTKAKQAYNPAPTLRICENCKHLRSKAMVTKGGRNSSYYSYALTCDLGGFSVNRKATCNEFDPAQQLFPDRSMFR